MGSMKKSIAETFPFQYYTKKYNTNRYSRPGGIDVTNPFKYGTAVSGEDFADREAELQQLSSRLRETVRNFLVAPRRYGKTSLIRNVLMSLQKQRFPSALCSKGILRKEQDHYIFEDVLFGRWVEKL
jgi:hypothetical protein